MATARLNLERGVHKELRIGEPRNETEQKALANLVTALRAAAEARLGCSEVSKLESLLHSGEGSDLTVHTRNPALPGSAEPLKLHSDIVRISSPLFNQPQISRVQLNWTEPAAHALAIFMYTSRVVIPANLLSETYRAASEAGVRALCVLLRTYSYFPLRLTSADHARHIRRFATQAGCSRIRALADDYLTHLANEPANITVVVPVPASWASSRVLPLGAHVIAVSFQHRPPFEHDTSSSLVLRASDPPNACIRLPCCDPETMSSSPSSSTNGPLNPGSSSSLSSSSSTTSATDDDDANKESATTAGIAQVPDDEPVVWLYVLCARREAGVVLGRLMQCMKDTLPSRGGQGEQDEDVLSDGEEGVRMGRSMSEEGEGEEKKEDEEAWRLALERTQVTENEMAGSKVACGGTLTELISAADEQRIFANGHVQTPTGSKDLKARVTIRNPSADTLSQLLTSTVDTLHYNIQDSSVYMTFPNVSAVRASLSTFSLDYDNNTTSDDKDWQPKEEQQQQQNNRLTRVRVPTVEMRTVLPIF